MSKFCSNCGSSLEAIDQFCSNCGSQTQKQQIQVQSEIKIEQEILQLLNIRSVIGRWYGQESNSAESTTSKRKGSLLLTSEEFIFVA